MSKHRKRTELGREIAKLRIDFSETGTEMAKKMDMSAASLWNMETGAVAVPYSFIVKLNKLYGKDLESIYINGGGLSKVVIELDELSQEDRKLAMTLYLKANKIDAPEPEVKEVEPEPVVKEKKKAPKPPALPDDVGFFSEDELDELGNLDDIGLL